MNKRTFSRAAFNIEALISLNDLSLKGEVLNLSLDGAFVSLDKRLKTGEAVDITIYLTGSTSSLSINIGGVVVRTEENGIAVQFTRIDEDSLMHLNNIVEKKLIEEYLESIYIS